MSSSAAPPARSGKRPDPGRPRRLRLLRLVLPGAMLAVVAALMTWPTLREPPAPVETDTSNGNVGQRSELIGARLLGTDSNNQPYAVDAKRVTRTPGNTAVVDLTEPRGDLELADGTWVSLQATTGAYNTETRRLSLSGEVALYTDAGYELHTPRVEVLMEQAEIHGDAAVHGHGPLGEIRGAGFRILERGRVIRILGPAHAAVRAAALDPETEGGMLP